MTMKHPVPFTYLGFYINSLIDSGASESITFIKTKIEDNSLFDYLNSKYTENFDTTIFSKIQLIEIENYFNDLSSSMDESRKMGIEKNGLCLLIGYCLEGAQRKVEDLHPPMINLYKQ